MISDELVYDDVQNWEKHTQEEKEAILTALGAVHA